MLARLLHLQGITASVFERDPHPLARPQGGSLDLHEDSGLLAIEEAGLRAEFDRFARPEDQGTKVYDRQATLLFEEADMGQGARPEIDRTDLRRILLESLPAGTVRWGQPVRRIAPEADGTVSVELDGVATEKFDLVVGADGARSRVRTLVSGADLEYSGVSFIELGLDDVDARHPQLADLVGRGKMFALGDRRCLIAQRNAHGHMRVYASLLVPEELAATGGLDFSSSAQAKADLAAHFAGWSPELLAFIHQSGDGLVRPWPIYALPVGHRWKNRPGITLLGDAAHLMSPFGGEGVNSALHDALVLAHALTERGDWRQAVRAYEEEMFVRIAPLADGAKQGLAETMSAEGLSHALEFMKGQHHAAV